MDEIIRQLRRDTADFDMPIYAKAADAIEGLREENDKQREMIYLLQSILQTEHEIIRVRQSTALKEGE